MGNIEKMGKGEGAGEGGERDWNHGLFGCFHDCGNCMCGYCCPICQVADSASKLGESYLLYFIMGCFVPCIPIFLVSYTKSTSIATESVKRPHQSTRSV